MAKKLSVKQKKQRAKRQRIKELKVMFKLLRGQLKAVTSELHSLHLMKKGGGRSKGNGYERRVAGIIVEYFQGMGISEKDCYRTPMSGGHRYASKTDPGDLTLSKRLAKMLPFSIECKFYKEIDIWQFYLPEKLWGKSWCCQKWLAQTCAAAKGKKGKYPLLVFRQNNSIDLAALSELMPVCAHIPRKLRFTYLGKTWYVVRFKDLLYRLREGAK